MPISSLFRRREISPITQLLASLGWPQAGRPLQSRPPWPGLRERGGVVLGRPYCWPRKRGHGAWQLGHLGFHALHPVGPITSGGRSGSGSSGNQPRLPCAHGAGFAVSGSNARWPAGWRGRLRVARFASGFRNRWPAACSLNEFRFLISRRVPSGWPGLAHARRWRRSERPSLHVAVANADPGDDFVRLGVGHGLFAGADVGLGDDFSSGVPARFRSMPLAVEFRSCTMDFCRLLPGGRAPGARFFSSPK